MKKQDENTNFMVPEMKKKTVCLTSNYTALKSSLQLQLVA